MVTLVVTSLGIWRLMLYLMGTPDQGLLSVQEGFLLM